MKTIGLIIAAGMLSLNALAGGIKANPDKYCTKMEGGKMVVMHEGKTITKDVTLANGTVVKTDGTIVKKDGTKTMLKDGQCVDKNGAVMEEQKMK